MTNRFLTFLIVAASFTRIAALHCNCDDGGCQGGLCIAPWSWVGPEHCQLISDGDKTVRGCNLNSSHCDMVVEDRSIDIAYSNGSISSFSGCCDDEKCESTFLRPKLEQLKNASCDKADDATSKDDFSCHCDAKDMEKLYDIALQRGVNWTAQTDVTIANPFDRATNLRRKVASFCKGNTCKFSEMLDPKNGVPRPDDAFPICAHFVRAKNGVALRGCSFAPRTDSKSFSSTLGRLQSGFPPNPLAAVYDVRVGVNVSDQFNFVFECRSDLCNEQTYYQEFLQQCLPGIVVPLPSNPMTAHTHRPPFRQYEENATVAASNTTTTAPRTTTKGGEKSVQIFAAFTILSVIISMTF